MRGQIYKVVPTIAKEEILENCKFEREIPDYGDVFTYKEFKEHIDSHVITDYDGSGALIIKDKIIGHTSVWIADRTIYFRDKFFIPFDIMYSLFGDDFKIAWFNK